jgi:hypothetical protein
MARPFYGDRDRELLRRHNSKSKTSTRHPGGTYQPGVHYLSCVSSVVRCSPTRQLSPRNVQDKFEKLKNKFMKVICSP